MIHQSVIRAIVFAGFLGLATFLSTCSPERSAEPVEYRVATQIALDWNHLLLELEWHTPGYRPPVTARMFAYAEMAAYEAALPGMDGYVSMETACQGYQKPVFDAEHYHLPSALNAAYARIAHAFFPTAPEEFRQKIGHLEAKYVATLAKSVSPELIQPSIEFGREAASAVWRYSLADSVGHDAFLYNFDRNFVVKSGPGYWKMEEEHPMPPLLPNWGNVRSFMVDTSAVKVNPPAVFDETAPSAFFSQALEVFSIANSSSSEDRWIAEFWSDDLPGLTVTPTGRWISIANQAIEKSNLTFPEVMDVYVKTSIALCDAAIICWHAKYYYQLERPESYIRRNIQADWRPVHNNPPFPSYPSGHAIFGSAASEVLNAAFGQHFSMTDRTHEGRKEFDGKARKFDSFSDMAYENAYSRVLLGVHYRMDCEEGLRVGKIIGQKVAAVSLRKEHVSILQR